MFETYRGCDCHLHTWMLPKSSAWQKKFAAYDYVHRNDSAIKSAVNQKKIYNFFKGERGVHFEIFFNWCDEGASL